MGLELHALPAGEGDALWIRWGEDGDHHQMLVDMGQTHSGPAIRERILRLPDDRRRFEVLVVTHIDSDHIGGVLTGLAQGEPIAGLSIGDIWFNGLTHLRGGTVGGSSDESRLEALGVRQGEALTNWLSTGWLDAGWNDAFGGGPIAIEDPVRSITLDGGLEVTIIGPPRERLEALAPTWETELARALRVEPGEGLVALGGERPTDRDPRTWAELDDLADHDSQPDRSKANGTSISLLLRWQERSILLTGDAWSADVVAGLSAAGGSPTTVDIVKLPHHGSRGNVDDAFVAAVDAPTWLISTNGAKHWHPDQEAIARVVRGRRDRELTLAFNEPSTYNGWWANEDRAPRFGYRYDVGTADDGLCMVLP